MLPHKRNAPWIMEVEGALPLGTDREQSDFLAFCGERNLHIKLDSGSNKKA